MPMAVLNGKNITHDPPRTELWTLLYAQVRQADGKDFRNILLEDRRLTPASRLSGRSDVVGAAPVLGFENSDAPVRGAVTWSQSDILAALAELGLPLDAPLSVLCVETMPTLDALRLPTPPTTHTVSHLTAGVVADRAGHATAVAVAVQDSGMRPLSDALGHVRILRTSPLARVPDVCCVGCP